MGFAEQRLFVVLMGCSQSLVAELVLGGKVEEKNFNQAMFKVD